MSKWWCNGSGMPKLQYCKGKGDIWGYIDAYHLDEGTCMVSWRAADAPIFTLAYRGNEVDALQAIAERNPSIESCDMSRTVLFSHSTGECFVAKKSIHLHPGDPQLILQGVVDTYTEKEGVGYEDVCGAELQKRFGTSTTQFTGVNGNGRAVNGDDPVLVTSLKIVDVVSDSKARDRVAIVQTLEKKLEARRAAGETSNRFGAMWCGEVTKAAVCGMLSLRTSGGMMRHRMGSVVILTNDPFLQVHMSVDEVDQKIRKSPGIVGAGKRASPQPSGARSLFGYNTSPTSHV